MASFLNIIYDFFDWFDTGNRIEVIFMKCDKCDGTMVKALLNTGAFFTDRENGDDVLLINAFICSSCGHVELVAQQSEMAKTK